MTSYHPSDDLLVDHLRGRLPRPAATVMDTHLHLCPACRRLAGALADIAGAGLVELEEAPVSPDLFADTMVKIAHVARAAETAPIPQVATQSFKRWRWVGLGVRLAHSKDPPENGWRTFLLRVEPGRSVPAHGHDGVELTCVLQGGFTDGERDYCKGDFAEASGPAPHELRAAAGEACICILATQAPLKWSGLTRWFQPAIGI